MKAKIIYNICMQDEAYSRECRLEEKGISFHNGLRHVHLQWEQIQRVNVIPSNWGKKIQVIADHAYFEFRTLGQVEAQGKTLGRFGFEQGDRILNQILEKSHLSVDLQ